jgi:putative transcriptional regulator
MTERTCAKTSKGPCDVPIVVKLDDVLHDRRMTLTELADRVGLTLANLSVLKTGKARAVRFSTLDAICEALRCQPGDILEHSPPTVVDETSAPVAARPQLKRPLTFAKRDKA